MAGEPSDNNAGWWDSCGGTQVLRTFRMAIQPSKLGLALLALALSFAWGAILDRIWVATDHGVGSDVLANYIDRVPAGTANGPGDGQQGMFHVWWRHQRRVTMDLLNELVPDVVLSAAGGRRSLPVSNVAASYPVSAEQLAWGGMGAVGQVGLTCRGLRWLIFEHWFFAILFLGGALLIWAFLGGALCRMAAVEFATGDHISLKEALAFTRGRLWGGFFLAPLLPLIILVLIGVALAVGGIFLSIPWLGDVVGGLLFGLALIGGGIAAMVLLGSTAGGSLFWPTVAAEGSDSFDALSRSFSYIFSRPWRAAAYALVMLLYGSLCWLFVRFLVFLMLRCTHYFVGIGSGLFGARESGFSKLGDLWAVPTLDTVYAAGGTGSAMEGVAAYLILAWVFLAVGLKWSFLASFYFSASTVVYFLLRRTVDATDLDDIYLEEYEDQPGAPSGKEEPLDADVTAKPPAGSTTAPTAPAEAVGETKLQPDDPRTGTGGAGHEPAGEGPGPGTDDS